MKKVLLVSVFVYLFAYSGFAQTDKYNCEATCFQSEIITAEKDEAGCMLYERPVFYQGTKCTPALSHYTVAIPCGEIKDLSNSQNWKQEFGTDPKTGLSGFKIDNIPNFGETSLSYFTVNFKLCPSDQSICSIYSGNT